MPRRMDKPAWAYVVENLRTIRQARFTDSTGKERPLGENGLALLMYLCDRVNSYGTVYMTAKTMSEDTGIHLSALKRLLAGFEQLPNLTTGEPWLTRVGTVRYQGRGSATVEYALTLVPDLWTGEVTGEPLEPRPGSPLSHPTGSPLATRTETKANTGAEKAFSNVPEPEPQPHPKPEPHPQVRSVQVSEGGEMEKRAGEIVTLCIGIERDRTPRGMGGGLLRKLQDEYLPRARKALRDFPSDTNQDLALRCVADRYCEDYEQVKARSVSWRPRAPQVSPDCPTCKGQGWYLGDYDHETNTSTRVTCSCTQDPTQERVSTDRGTNTSTPTTGATADPQSVLDDLTRQLRRVV